MCVRFVVVPYSKLINIGVWNTTYERERERGEREEAAVNATEIFHKETDGAD